MYLKVFCKSSLQMNTCKMILVLLFALFGISLAQNNILQHIIPLEGRLLVDLEYSEFTDSPPTVSCSVQGFQVDNGWHSQTVFYRDHDLEVRFGLMVQANFNQEGNVQCQLIPNSNDLELRERTRTCLDQCSFNYEDGGDEGETDSGNEDEEVNDDDDNDGGEEEGGDHSEEEDGDESEEADDGTDQDGDNNDEDDDGTGEDGSDDTNEEDGDKTQEDGDDDTTEDGDDGTVEEDDNDTEEGDDGNVEDGNDDTVEDGGDDTVGDGGDDNVEDGSDDPVENGGDGTVEEGSDDTKDEGDNTDEEEDDNTDGEGKEGTGGPCNKDYFYIKEVDSCYSLSNYSAQWYDSECACASRGGTLAIINSKEEQTILAAYLNVSHWIGLNDREEEGKHVWRDGSPLIFTKWATESNNTEAKDCVEMSANSNYSWSSQSCDLQRRFLCEAADPKKRVLPGICPEGWIMNPVTEVCYYISPTTQTWDDSNKVCSDIGGSLSSIHSTDDSLFIKGLSGMIENVWTGLNDKVKKDSYVWTDGSSTAYKNWADGTPNVFQYITSFFTFDKYCVELKKDKSFMWNVNSCSNKLKALCTRQAEKLPRSVCPTGFEADGKGSCFLLSQLKSDYNGSAKLCASSAVGAELGLPTNDLQGNFVSGMLKKSNVIDVWLGVKVGEAIGLKASAFLDLKGVLNLLTGRYYNQDCVRMQNDGTWYGKYCTYKYNYVCATVQHKSAPAVSSLG